METKAETQLPNPFQPSNSEASKISIGPSRLSVSDLLWWPQKNSQVRFKDSSHSCGHFAARFKDTRIFVLSGSWLDIEASSNPDDFKEYVAKAT